MNNKISYQVYNEIDMKFNDPINNQVDKNVIIQLYNQIFWKKSAEKKRTKRLMNGIDWNVTLSRADLLHLELIRVEPLCAGDNRW